MDLHQTQIESECQMLLRNYPELQDDEQLRADMLEGSTDLYQHIRKLLILSNEAAAHLRGLREYRNAIAVRMDRLQSKYDIFRRFVHRLMTLCDLARINLDVGTVTIQSGGARRVIITDLAALPDSLVKIERIPLKTEIRELLLTGQYVPGAELSNHEPHLVVRS